MFEMIGWMVALLMAVVALYNYLKQDHVRLHEQRVGWISGDGLAPHLEKILFELLDDIRKRAYEAGAQLDPHYRKQKMKKSE
jgi:hypothetical protein